MTVLDVWQDGNELVCPAGRVGKPRTACHEGWKRMCVHAVEPLPRALLFDKTRILGYGFQPVAYIGSHFPAIVSRRGDVVTLAFDRQGETAFCTNRPNIPFTPNASWQYQLHPLRWRDDGDLSDTVLLGVWPD